MWKQEFHEITKTIQKSRANALQCTEKMSEISLFHIVAMVFVTHRTVHRLVDGLYVIWAGGGVYWRFLEDFEHKVP